MLTVPVLLLLAGAVILAGVVAVAMGHGGEMAEFPSDYVPPALGDLLTAADVTMLRPPSALWGYNTRVTDEALSRIAQIVTERDVEIAVLRQQLADLRSGSSAGPPASVRFAAAEPAAAEPAEAERLVAEPAEAEPAAAAPAEADAAPPAEPAAAEPAAAAPAEADDPEADEPEAAAAGTGAAAHDEPPPVPVVPSDEAAAPGDD
jgi:hypothetical protein